MSSDEQHDTSRGGTFLPLLLTLFFGGGAVLFLVLVSGGFFVYVVGSVAALGGIATLHYLLWGQALSNETAAERAAEEEKARREADY